MQQIQPHGERMLEKEKKEIWKCFKCNKEGYIVRDYKEKQSMKKWRIQEESDEQEDKEKQNFGEDLE